MKLFFRILIVTVFYCGFAQAQDVKSGENANFELGLGYGLMNEKSLVNIDVKIYMPIRQHYSTQLFLNSNYLITGSSKEGYAQSEFSSNWFARNDYGRLGVGIGVGEIEPRDKKKPSDRAKIGRLMGDLYLNSLTFIANYTSYKKNLSNVTSSRVGLSYYWDDDHRLSLYREKFSDFDGGWRLETYYQPEKYRQKGSVGFIVRAGHQYEYAGVTIRYYFDEAISLKQRERCYH